MFELGSLGFILSRPPGSSPLLVRISHPPRHLPSSLFRNMPALMPQSLYRPHMAQPMPNEAVTKLGRRSASRFLAAQRNDEIVTNMIGVEKLGPGEVTSQIGRSSEKSTCHRSPPAPR